MGERHNDTCWKEVIQLIIKDDMQLLLTESVKYHWEHGELPGDNIEQLLIDIKDNKIQSAHFTAERAKKTLKFLQKIC